jgi:hypothetical protein
MSSKIIVMEHAKQRITVIPIEGSENQEEIEEILYERFDYNQESIDYYVCDKFELNLI